MTMGIYMKKSASEVGACPFKLGSFRVQDKCLQQQELDKRKRNLCVCPSYKLFTRAAVRITGNSQMPLQNTMSR